MPRKYRDEVPHPFKAPYRFNNYLRQNNRVLNENTNWILIKNRFIDNQLVCFAKLEITELKQVSRAAYLDLVDIIDKYKDNHIYINSIKDKSIPDRLHLHIKLSS